MKDLISREKALDCFHDWVDKYGDVHTADEMTEYQAIEALPVIEQGWIPVSERLPEEMTRVLTTIKMPRKEPKVRSGIYSDGLFMNDNGDVWRSADKEVKAWMPLPEAYRGEQNETN